jgi:hypothetical protein
MVHGFKPGKHVKKLYSYHKVSTNPWFQTMRLHEVSISNHVSYFKTITLSSNSLFQTMKAKHIYSHCFQTLNMVCQTIMVCQTMIMIPTGGGPYPWKILKINSLDAISLHLTTRSSTIYKNARRREMIRGQYDGWCMAVYILAGYIYIVRRRSDESERLPRHGLYRATSSMTSRGQTWHILNIT